MPASGNEDFIMAAVFSLVGLIAIFLGFIKLRKFRLIKDTPRSKIRSLAMGIVEIHGSVGAFNEALITAPFSKSECVYYKYSIKEYRRKSSGKKGGSTYTWETVSSGNRGVPFLAIDETGQVCVNPDGAESEIRACSVYHQDRRGFTGDFRMMWDFFKSLQKWDGNPAMLKEEFIEGLQLVSEKSALGRARVGDRRFYEYRITPGDTLFVLGTAANDSTYPGDVVIRKGQNEKTFIISDRPEKGVLKELKKAFWVAYIFGVIFFVVGIAIALKHMGLL